MVSLDELQDAKTKAVQLFADKLGVCFKPKKDLSKTKKDFLRIGENLDTLVEVLDSAVDDAVCIIKLTSRLQRSGDLSPRERTLEYVFAYLLTAEGFVCNFLNFVTYLLVTLDHDLYSLTKKGYVKDDLNQIRKVEMATKIAFLNNHGFGALTKEYDSTLRNDVAHHNYKIDANGTLLIRGESVAILTEIKSLQNLLRVAKEACSGMRKYAKKADADFAKLSASA